MNFVGKTLVVIQTAISLVFLTWAMMIVLQFNDFGWKEPIKVWESKKEGSASGYVEPSILDKRTAQLHELYRQVDRALPGVQPPLEELLQTMEYLPKNHLFYKAELDKLANSEEEISPLKLVWDEGRLVLESKDSVPGKAKKAAKTDPPLGKPYMEGTAPGITKDIPITKSTKKVTAELDDLLKQIKTVTAEVTTLIRDTDEITVQLNGKRDDKNNLTVIGLYEVLDVEQTMQDKIRQELEYVTPIFVDALRRVESFNDRYAGMFATLKKLQPAAK